MKRVKVEVEAQGAVNFDHDTDLDAVNTAPVPVLNAALPEEILEKIFLSLDDSKDLLAVSHATPQFRRIVKPSMTVWAIEQIFPLIFSKLKKKDVLNCRLVCKKWNSSVNIFVQNHPENRSVMPYPYQTPVFDDHNLSRNYPDYRPDCRATRRATELFGTILYSVDQMEKISEEMKSTTGNPFVTRSVSFSNADDEDEERYWDYALSFLRKYGEHIWHTDIGPEGLCALLSYQVLFQALCLLPNVRTLTVYGFDGGHCGDKNRLRRFMEKNPLPSLPHLHTIDCSLLENVEGKLVADEMLERYSGQLGSLQTSVRTGDPAHWNTLTQMTALTICLDSLHSWGRLCRSLVLPRLAKLSLTVTVCGSEVVSISKLLKPLQKGFPSLVYLHIGLAPFSHIRLSSGPPRFLLENVKTLEVNDHCRIHFNHILSYFPALEYALVCHRPGVPIHCDVDDEREMEIRLLMRNRSMYKSDVWSRIQTLKEFTLARFVDTGCIGDEVIVERQFTRRGYDWYVGDKL